LRKLPFVTLVLLFTIAVASCSKDDNPPAQPPPPEQLDTLGAGWQRIKPAAPENLEDIFFVNNQVGFVIGDQYAGKTVDGGLTWTSVIPDSLKQDFINVFFLDINVGWVTGSKFLLRTIDGGATWKKMYTGTCFDVQFFDTSNGYVTIIYQGLFKTTDGGQTLQRVNTNSASGLFFVDQNKGWFCDNRLFKTDNGGVSFSPLFNKGSSGVYAIQFTDDLHGWMAGGGIYRTVDGGVTMETLFYGVNGDIHFFDNNNGFILAGNNIYSSTDGGKTNTILCTVHKTQLVEFHFTDPNHGWATGVGGYVYRYVKP